MVGLQLCKTCGRRCHVRLHCCPYCTTPLAPNTSGHLHEEVRGRIERLFSSANCLPHNLPTKAEDGSESSGNLSDSPAENSVTSQSTIDENTTESQRNAPVYENCFINLSAIKKSAMHCTNLATVEEVLYRFLGSGYTVFEALIGASIMVKAGEPGTCLFEALREATGLETYNIATFSSARGIKARSFMLSSPLNKVECFIAGEWILGFNFMYLDEKVVQQSKTIIFKDNYCQALLNGPVEERSVSSEQVARSLPDNVALTPTERTRIYNAIPNAERIVSNWIPVDSKVRLFLDENGIIGLVREKNESRNTQIVSKIEQVINLVRGKGLDVAQLSRTRVEKHFSKLSEIPPYASRSNEVRENLHWYLFMAALEGVGIHRSGKYSCLLDALCDSNETASGIEVDYPISSGMLRTLGIVVWRLSETGATCTQMPDGVTIFVNDANHSAGKVHVTSQRLPTMQQAIRLTEEFVIGAYESDTE